VSPTLMAIALLHADKKNAPALYHARNGVPSV
jgi:hypothetical protein